MAISFGRWTYALSLWKEGLWGRTLGLVWGAYTALLALREGELLDVQPSGLLPMILNISWAWWAFGTVSVLLIWCFEASYRVQRKALDVVDTLEQRLSSPNRVARERMAGQLADDRLKMLDLLVMSTIRVLDHSWAKHGKMVPVELSVLAARFQVDESFCVIWDSYCDACLEFWNKYPPENNGNAFARHGEISNHYSTYGARIQSARDLMRDYLMEIKPH